MGRVRVVCFYIQSSEGGSPYLCRLRTDRLALVSKFDYLLTHIGFIGSRKLRSSDGHRVGRHPTMLKG
jgi:hypothetical protein